VAAHELEILVFHQQPGKKGRSTGLPATTAMTQLERPDGPCDFKAHSATKATSSNHAVPLVRSGYAIFAQVWADELSLSLAVRCTPPKIFEN